MGSGWLRFFFDQPLKGRLWGLVVPDFDFSPQPLGQLVVVLAGVAGWLQPNAPLMPGTWLQLPKQSSWFTYAFYIGLCNRNLQT